MTQEEKQLLAESYANAWMAVKGRPATVEVLDHGWFSVHHSHVSYAIRVRASKLLQGLVTLTSRMKNNDFAK